MFAAGTSSLALLAACALAGCVQVSVTSADSVTQGAGAVAIHFPPAQAAQIARVAGFGLVLAQDGFTLGWAHSTYVVAPPSCQLVVWIETPEQARELQSLLEGRTDVCRITEKGGQQ